MSSSMKGTGVDPAFLRLHVVASVHYLITVPARGPARPSAWQARWVRKAPPSLGGHFHLLSCQHPYWPGSVLSPFLLCSFSLNDYSSGDSNSYLPMQAACACFHTSAPTSQQALRSHFHQGLCISSEIPSLHSLLHSQCGLDAVAPRDDVGDSWVLELDWLWFRWLLVTYQLMTYLLSLTFPIEVMGKQ